MSRRLSSNSAQERGFALVVIAALFIAFSVIAAVAIDRTAATAQTERVNRARAQLSRLSYALMQYANANINRFPCPASLALVQNHVNFGVANLSCETGSPAGNDILGGGVVLRGLVPVRELLNYGVDVNDAFDPWNSRIMYIVRRNTTLTATTVVAPTTASANLTLTNFFPGSGLTGPTLMTPDFILISYGADRVGAYAKSQTSIAIACTTSGSPASGTARRDKNCADNTSEFIRGPHYTAGNATASLGSATDYFDDIVSYYSR